jgi:GT2 family glycosyltransferase
MRGWMKKAVLFLIFNRPETTKKVFEAIRRAKPPQLYVASDGSRLDKDGEAQTVEETRRMVLDSINWDCEVKTLFRDKNLGCGKAVSEAITWFFKQEEDGIILEDDCLPNHSFFKYCEVLLDYYKDNKKIMHISGDQFVPNLENRASYYFAKIQHCWGWASWADRWLSYNFNLQEIAEKDVKNFSENKNVQKYWLEILNKMKGNEVDTWDYQWVFAIVLKNGLCINPSKNLISNIGFGSDSTHTADENNLLANMPTYEIKKITHPVKVEIDEKAVNYIYKNHFGINI